MRNDFSVSAGEGCVSCRTSSYTIQHLTNLGLPVGHVVAGTGYTLEELQDAAAFIPWNPFLVFFQNAHQGLSDEQFVTLCTSFHRSPDLRPLMTAAGLWYDPARYFEWVAAPGGAIPQLFRCLETRCERVGKREVVLVEQLRPGYDAPPDLFWESQAIGFAALPTYFGLGPAVVSWEPIDRGATYRVRLPRRRPVRTLLSMIASWFRRETAEDLRSVLQYGHERSLRLEREAAARKRAEEAIRKGKEQLRRVSDAIPGIVYQYALEPDGTQGFTFVSGGAVGLTGYTPEELLADAGIIWRQVLPEFVPEVQASIAASARDGTPWHEEFQFRTKGGNLRWVRGHSVPEPPDVSGRVVWNGILTDITGEREAESARRARDELLRKLSEQVPGVIYQFRLWPDGRSCFPYASEGIRSIYEVTPDDVRESAAAVFARLHPDDTDAVVASINRSVETLEEWRCEYRVRLPERGERWLEGHSMPERLPDGSTLWHGHISDVTDRKRADEALRTSETRFRHMAENIPGAIIQYTLRPDGTDRVDYMSSACDDVWEVPAEAVRADSGVHWRMVHHEDVEGLRAAIAEGAERLGPVSHSWRITTPFGRLKWLQVYARPEPLEEGSIRWNCAIFDVTAQKSADLALRESEERFRLASEAFQGLLYDLNLVTGTVYRSAGVVDLVGYPPEEVPADKDWWVRLLHPDDRDRVLSGVTAALAAGDRVDLEYRLRHRDGHYVDVWDRGQVVRGPDGAPVRIVGSTLDQTTRKRAEDALRESEERLRIFIENVPAGVVMLDRELRYLAYSRRWLTDYNLTGHDLHGRSHHEIFPDIPERWKEIHRRCLGGVAERCEEDRFDRSDGGCIYLRWEIQPWYSATGSVGGLVFFTEVITERVLAEQALRESEEKLRTILDSEPECVKLLDRQGRLLEMNPTGLRMIEASDLSEVRGAAVNCLVADDDRAAFDELVAGVFRGESRRLTFEIRGFAGTRRVLDTHSVPLWSADRREVRALLGVTRDVTDRVRAEQALRESEERFRTLIDDLDVGVVLLSPAGGMTLSNPAAAAMLGLTPDQFCGVEPGDPRWQIVREDETPFAPDDIPFSVVVRTRRPLRNVVVGARNQVTGGRCWMQVNGTPRLAPDGTLLHVILTFVDITARKLAEDELRLKDAAIAGAINAIAFTAMDGRLSYVNRAFLELWGYDREDEVLGRSPTEFWHEPAVAEGVIAALKAVGNWQGEMTGIRRDGTPFDTQVSANLIRDPLGRPTHMMASFLDVTDRKRAAVEVVRARDAAEDALARLKTESARAEQFSRLVEVAGQGIGIARLDGALTYLNPFFRRLLELPPDADIGGRVFWDFVPTDLHPVLAETVLTTTRDVGNWTGEFELMTSTGRRVSIVNNVFLIRDPDGAVAGYANIATDITPLKRAEERLRSSEARLSSFFTASPVGMAMFDADGRWSHMNPTLAALNGLPVEAHIGRRPSELLPPDLATGIESSVRRILDTGIPDVNREITGSTPAAPGVIRHWLFTHAPIFDHGDRPTGVGVIVVETTERNRAEVALRESEERLRVALSAATAIGFVWDPVSDSLVRYFSTEPALPPNPSAPEPVARVRALIHPEDRAAFDAGLAACLDGGPEYRNLYRVVRPDGGVRWLEEWGTLVRDVAGRPARLIGVSIDVTERKRGEDALRDAEYRQRLALDAGRMGTWDWDVVNGTVLWDARQQELFGFAPGEYDGHPDTLFTRVHPADAVLVRQHLEHTLATGQDYAAEFRAYPRPGVMRWVAGRGRLIGDAAGRPARMIGINYDRTDEKRTLLALEEAERNQRLALDAGRMGTWDWEIGTDRLDWDDREQALFGFPPGGFDGRLTSFLARVHPDDLAAVRQVLAEAVAGKDFDGEFRILPPSGEVRWIHGSGAVYPGNGDSPGRLIGINYDVTDRVRAEQALRDSVCEKEAMLKEIHHRVKNNLQVISSLLNLQAERIADSATRAVFLESQSRVRAMALVHETLYGSESLARIELPRYLDRLCDSLLQTFGGNERVRVQRDIAPVDLDLDRALPVGLIVSELVSNALKYAFPGGGQGLIRVTLAPSGDADLELSVSDDGVGLPADLDLDQTPSLGLYLVRVLTRQLRGALTVGRAGVGVSFTLRFPK